MSDPRPVGDDDLEAAVDGRLAPERRGLVEAYMMAHPEARLRHEAVTADGAALRAALQSKLEEPVPARLRIGRIAAVRRHRKNSALLRVAAALALFGVGLGSGWTIRGSASSGPDDLAFKAASAWRTFTVEKRHPVEVAAEDGEHLTTWLSNRLDRRIMPPDLTSDGLHLIGGRVLPNGAGKPAALLMYDDDRGTRLTVYIQDGSTAGRDLLSSDDDGVPTVLRSERGLTFAVSARTDRANLIRVAQTVSRQLEAEPAEVRPHL